ncbi:MAG: PQQ-dependent sugar dehydrogenase [Bacteroidota bacterium]|nr:PQQ-dependent sugar dehydrogenase [Candidatus Kapabacteria bacterium]MCX7937478.1 PQQ-dependent sugar dehydrogenase [Chlorobiota bacterium]MDW8075145.1 PQQ-dependent sugar dehydrogenase [Bacteroidota bacterium]
MDLTNRQQSRWNAVGLYIALLATSIAGSSAQTLAVRTVARGLDTPWEILWGPDGWLWVTERYGRISRVHPETGQILELARLGDVYEQGESGLLGMALHPNFVDSPFVFVAYTYREGSQIFERIVRFRYDGTTLSQMQVLLDRIRGASIHNGCRLLILPDRTLLITTGDANNTATSQNLQSLNGKVLRVRLDGSIPDDNPFPNSPLWAVGLRNSQGLTWHDGIVYASEHGPNSDDEINIIEAGRNYGWPEVLGWCDTPTEQAFCTEHRVVEPIAAWTPTIAPCGLAYYAGTRFPMWQHSLLLVTLKAARLVVLKLDSTRRKVVQERHYLAGELGRLRAICVSPDGRIFLGTSNRDGRGTPAADDDRIVELSIASATEQDYRSLALWFEPEPLSSSAYLRVSLPYAAPIRLTLSDMLGRTCAAWDLGHQPDGIATFELTFPALAGGSYVATLSVGDIHVRRTVLLSP